MKRLLSLLVLVFSISILAGAQEFVAPTKQKSVEYTDTTTTYTYKIEDNSFNVYKSKSGAFYIWKTSKKTGKQYKYYLPKEIQKQMGRKYND
jgi:hypothetical protein